MMIHIYALFIIDTFRTKIEYDSCAYDQSYPWKYVTIVYILQLVTNLVILYIWPAIFSLSTTEDQTNGPNFKLITTLITACNMVGSWIVSLSFYSQFTKIIFDPYVSQKNWKGYINTYIDTYIYLYPYVYINIHTYI